MNEENKVDKTPREKYLEKVQSDLFEASMSKRFIDSEEGKYVINYIAEVVSSLTNQMINKRVEHDEYVELRAKIDILRRLKQVLEAKASDTVIAKLQEDLSIAESGE